MTWDQTKVAFCSIPEDEIELAKSLCMEGEECVSCGLRQLRLEREVWDVDLEHLSRGGVDYHVNDFIYIRPETPPPSLYMIGQIVEIVVAKAGGQHRVKARLLERYDTVIPHKDDRRTDEVRTITSHCPTLVCET